MEQITTTMPLALQMALLDHGVPVNDAHCVEIELSGSETRIRWRRSIGGLVKTAWEPALILQPDHALNTWLSEALDYEPRDMERLTLTFASGEAARLATVSLVRLSKQYWRRLANGIAELQPRDLYDPAAPAGGKAC